MRRLVLFLLVFGLAVVSPSAASAVTLVGDTTVEATDDSNGAGQAQAWQYTATTTGTSNAIVWYINPGTSPNMSVRVGLYTDSNNQPGTLIDQALANVGTTVNSWFTMAIPAHTITAGVKYWIAILGVDGTPHWPDQGAAGTSCPSYMSGTGLTTLPATWSGTSSVPSCPASMYVQGANPTPPPSNTVAPALSGTQTVGSTLTVSNGTWTGSPTSYAYKWVRCNSAGVACSQITGQAANTYTLVAADGGNKLFATVTATNAGGSTQANSNMTGVIATGPVPANTAVPTVGGTAQQGQTLTTTNGTWTNSPTSYAYQWKDCDTAGANCVNIAGATGSTYALVAGDVGKTVRSTVVASNANGASAPAQSAQTAVVTAAPPPPPPSNSTLPSISGSTVQGSTLTAANGTWTNSPTSYAYQWHTCTAPTSCVNAGTNASTYATVAGDVGHTITVTVTATNAGGSGSATSNAVGPITAPTQTVVYRVAAGRTTSYTDSGGHVWQADAFNDGGGGNQTSSTTATITNTPDSGLYQWERWGNPGFTYTFPSLTAGASYSVTLKFAEIYFTASGQRKFNVTINGAAVLTNFDIVADAGAGNKADDKTFTATANASGQIVVAFVNASPAVDNPKISAIQVATSGGGGNSPPANTAVPVVSGSPVQGSTLSTTNGTWTGTPAPTFTYQWQHCLSGTCSNVAGATSSTYVVAASDVGDTMRSVVTGTNSVGSASANSAQTAVVTASGGGVGSCTQGAPGTTATFNANTYTREGWDTFTKDAAVGSFASDGSAPVYTGDQGMQWFEYGDNWTSTYSAGKEGYQPSTVQSVHNGVLDFNLHNDTNGNPVGANPSPVPGGNRYQTYGAWSFCEKIVPNAGSNLADFYQANLLWPQNDADWQKAESDYPEDALNSTAFEAFAHYGGAGAQDNYTTGTIDPAQWHVYTQTWGPGFRSYFIDGRLIGTSTNQVWSGPERWQFQIEPSGTNNGGSGHLYINWAWIGTAGGAPPSPPTNTTAPAITGTPKVGSTLTVSNGAWTNSPTSYGYQWASCPSTGACTNVGTNQATYVPVTGDVGKTIKATVTATNAGGSGSAQAPAVGPVTAAGGIQHIVWVWMENHGYSQVIGAPYIASLASTYGSATNYFALDHPSLPNYIEATSGGSQGVGDDADPSSHPLNVASIFSQLPGGQSRSLMGAMPSNCFKSDSGAGPDYVAHHNPMAYYTNLGTDCANFNVPLGATPDISAKFTFIAPDECNNMHDCSVATGDSYLQGLIPAIQARPEYQAGNTAIFVVWDEDGSTTGGPQENNHVASLVISPFTHGVSDATSYTHYSLLKTAEQLLGLSQLGSAASANSMVGHFGF